MTGHFPFSKGECYAQKIWLLVVMFLIPIVKDIQEDRTAVVLNGKLISAECFREVPHRAQHRQSGRPISTGGCKMD